MHIGQRVEYETGWAEFGVGIVVGVDAEHDIVTVIDEDDGSKWRGPMERLTTLACATPTSGPDT